MSLVDKATPNPIGIVDEEVVIEFDEHPPELPDNIEIVEVEDGAIIDFDPVESENQAYIEELQSLPHGANLAEFLDDDYLKVLAQDLESLYDDDLQSRSDWVERFTEGLDNLGFTNEERDDLFEGASGVYHPLLAEAAAQFQAQAYKELLPADGPVSVKTVGASDRNNPQAANVMERAARVKEFMNYQITDVMEEFDPELDQMLFYLPLSGSTFKKSYFDQSLGRAVSQFCTAEDIVVNYGATNLNTAESVTHRIRQSANALKRQQVFGFYRDIDMGSPSQNEQNSVTQKVDQFYGQSRPSNTDDEYELHEMHVNLSIPGLEHEAGLALPYIVTICSDTSDILSIRRNWKEEDQLFNKIEYFTHYKFLPGLGFYGFGFIHMIGGLAESATSILRQLIDAGTFANLPGGFKQRGVKVDRDNEPVSPGEWRDIDLPNENINNALMPMPYKEPSSVLFQLLGFLVDSGRRFASIADTTISESGSQQNPVGTTMALIERGAKVMSAVHKRLHYAQKREFKKLARIFAENLPAEYPYTIGGIQKAVKQEDFGPEVDVIPVSDPNIFSAAQRVSLAQAQLQMAQGAPEIHDLREAYKRMYIALEVKDPDGILMPEEEQVPISPALEHARALENKKLQAFEGQDHSAHIEAHIAFMQLPLIQQSPEFYSNLLQDVMQHISFIAQAQAMAQVQQMGNIPQEYAQQMIQGMVSAIENQLIAQILPQTVPNQPDPMVEMHEREMGIKEEDLRIKAEIADAKNNLDALKAREAEITKRLQIQSQEQIANQDVAQNRESSYLNANLKATEIYNKALQDATKNDVTGGQNARI